MILSKYSHGGIIMNYNGLLYRALHRVTRVLSSIQWVKIRSWFNKGRRYDLTEQERHYCAQILRSGHYLILTQHKSYLTTYLIGAMCFIKTGKWPTYCHVLMNLDVGNPDDKTGFKLMEATNSGVHFSTFEEVFDCDNICIIEPKNMDLDEWQMVMKGLAKQLGKKYDDFFNMKDDSHVSCVEMCFVALRTSPNFVEDFPHLSEMIKEVGNLTPQMYRDCLDFNIIYETKH
jgi:hypothetical protein